MAEPSDDNRTHEPTARRVAEARSQGHIATSRDLCAGLVMLAACLAFIVGGKAALGGLVVVMRDALGNRARDVSAGAAIIAGGSLAMSILALPLFAILVAALTAGVVQTRGLVRAWRIDSKRITPRLRRLWGADKLGLAGKELGKIVVLLSLAVVLARPAAGAIFRLTGARAAHILAGLFVLAKNLGLALALGLLGLGVADYLWHLYRHRKALRMTGDEVKREHKETEGDPVVKLERRRIHVQLSQALALAELAQADLVLVDPGQTAVALRYAPNIAQAPLVMSKGKHRLAARMEAVAFQAGVPIVVDPSLAAELAATEEGEEVPEALYEPIARQLAETGARRRGIELGAEDPPLTP